MLQRDRHGLDRAPAPLDPDRIGRGDVVRIEDRRIAGASGCRKQYAKRDSSVLRVTASAQTGMRRLVLK